MWDGIPALPPPWVGFAAAAIAGLALYEGFRASFRHETDTACGTAAWASRGDLRRAGLLGGSGLLLGRTGNRLVRLATDRHLLTVAPTRSGKGVGAIVPNLLTYPGSTLVIDPKGENACITARARREMGQPVHVLDPWGLSGETSAAFNPLAALGNRPDAAEDAALIADALVPGTGSGDAAFWQEEAKGLLAGLILHTVTAEPPERRGLARVRDFLTLDPKEFNKLLTAMAGSDAAGGLVARAANRLKQKSDRERSGVISTAQANTHFLDSPKMARVLGGPSSLMLESLKRRPCSLFLVLPAERLGSHGRWLRLMVSLALAALARVPGKPALPVLFILDEFAALGHLEAVETAMGLMAGHGVQLWPILQDFSQLKSLYGERWQTFLANAGVVQAFSVAENMTAEYLSDMLGTRTVTLRGESAGWSAGRHGRSKNHTENLTVQGRPLLMPDELMRLPADQELLLMPGRRPALLKRLRYYTDPEFRGRFDPFPPRPAKGGLVPCP